MPSPEVRYCTTEDGVRIAYCVEGTGYPLLWCPILVESFSLSHLVPGYAALLDEISLRWQLIRYDMRGTGLSQRETTDYSNDALVADVRAVAHSIGAPSIALWANTMSGPRAITYAVQNPETVSHLILHDTFGEPKGAFSQEAAKGIAELARTNWKIAAQTIADMGSLVRRYERRRQTDERTVFGGDWKAIRTVQQRVYRGDDDRKGLCQLGRHGTPSPGALTHHSAAPLVQPRLPGGRRPRSFIANSGLHVRPNTWNRKYVYLAQPGRH